MNSKKLSILFAVLSAALVIVCIILFLRQDRTSPEMSFTDTDVVYSQGMSMEPLYQGVTAVDDRDGDITDKIVIEKIVASADGRSVSVTYAVNDSSNNFTKKVRVFEQVPAETADVTQSAETADVTPPAESGSMSGQESEDAAEAGQEEQIQEEEREEAEREAAEREAEEKEKEEALKKEKEEQEKQEAEEKAKEEAAERARQEAKQDENTDGEETQKSQPPVLELAEKEVTTRVGVRPAWVNIIKTLTDDQDNYDTLYRNLVLDGTYNDSKAGDYDVTLRTSDSDGNKSAVCKLKIHVLQ